MRGGRDLFSINQRDGLAYTKFSADSVGAATEQGEPQRGESLTVLKMAGMVAGSETRERPSTTLAVKRFNIVSEAAGDSWCANERTGIEVCQALNGFG